MKAGKVVLAGILLFVLTAFLLITPFIFQPSLGGKIVAYLLNQSTKEFFDQSIHLSSFRLDRNLRVHIEGLEGNLRTVEGPVPLEVRSLHSEGSVIHFFSPQGLLLNFEGLRSSHSLRKGIQGVCRIRGGREWFVDLRATVESLGLEDITGFNPDFLAGSEGEMKGEITLKADSKAEPEFRANLRIEKPGGRLQSRFFDGVAVYLPQMKSRRDLEKLSAAGGLVGFQDARLQFDLVQSDRIKVFLHILVPDYNLNLNLNMDIRVDEKNAFLQLAQIVGIVKWKVSS